MLRTKNMSFLSQYIRRILALIFLSFISLESTKSSDMLLSYRDVFTDEIYNQTSFSHASLSQSEYESKAIEQLYDLKERSLTKAFASTWVHKLSIYMGELEKAKKVTQTKAKAKLIIGIFEGMVKIISSQPLAFVPLIGPHVEKVSSALTGISSIAEHTADLVIGKEELRQQLGHFYSETLKYKNNINSYRLGLKSEPIKNYEEQYVKQKRSFAPSMQKTIELALIKSRLPSQAFCSPQDVLKQALSLPLSHKNLLLEETIGLLSERYDDDEFFSRYDDSIQEFIKGIIKEAVCSSNIEDNDTSESFRRSYYIWGNPGMGKSELAKGIAKFLGVPYYETSLGDSKLLTSPALYGVTWLSGTANPGWLAKIFLQENARHKNAVLIINDLHLLIDSNMGANNSQQAIKFLLDFLDPEKRKLKNNYFNAEIDISRLLILITGNSPIPQENKYKALIDRFEKIIQLPDFSIESVRPLLLKKCNLYEKKYFLQHLNIDHNIEITTVLEQANNTSLRELTKLLRSRYLSMPSNPQAKSETKEDAQARKKQQNFQKIVVHLTVQDLQAGGNKIQEWFQGEMGGNNSNPTQFYKELVPILLNG